MSGGGRPLEGRTVLVTRPDSDWVGLQEALRRLGATPVFAASIRQIEPTDPAAVDLALSRIGTYAWIVFTSPAGARFFDQAARRHGLRGDEIPPSLAALGEGTARTLASRGYRVERVADARHGRGLAAALAGLIAPGERVLWVRPERAAPGLAADLAAAGVELDGVAFYATVASPEAAGIAADLRLGRFDAAAWTSPSSLECVLDAAGPDRESVLSALRRIPSVALGPTTEAALRASGIEPAAVAADPSEAELERLLAEVLAP